MNFKALFKQEPGPISRPAGGLQAGETMPLVLSGLVPDSEAVLVGIVSLYCSHCVDLLPDLTALVREADLPFVLVSDGTESENEEIGRHFDVGFPIVSVREEEIAGTYKAFETPYFYIVRSDGRVAEGFPADTARELADRWRAYRSELER